MAFFKQALKIFDFNFTKPIPETQEKNSLFPTDEGIAHAIAFWFELKLNPKVRFPHPRWIKTLTGSKQFTESLLLWP